MPRNQWVCACIAWHFLLVHTVYILEPPSQPGLELLFGVANGVLECSVHVNIHPYLQLHVIIVLLTPSYCIVETGMLSLMLITLDNLHIGIYTKCVELYLDPSLITIPPQQYILYIGDWMDMFKACQCCRCTVCIHT